MKRLGLAFALVGCNYFSSGSDEAPQALPDASAPVVDAFVVRPAPGDCHQSISLYGMDMTGSGSTVVGPLSIDTDGITLCLTLDARDNILVGHFGAGTDRESAATSSYRLTLYDAQGALLQDGWDVTFGSSQPTTFENLEYGVTKGTVLEAKLVVSMAAGTGSTTVGLALIEPYE